MSEQLEIVPVKELPVAVTQSPSPEKTTAAQAKVDAVAGLNGSQGLHLVKHGMRYAPEYKTWCRIIYRCENPKAINYERYGGRGITVCPEWRVDFLAFYNDMGNRPSRTHTLERKNNMLGYSKDNCVWATALEQANNKRNNVMVEFSGRVQSVAAWCRELGLEYNTVRQRIYRNDWTPERAFSK